MCDPLVHRTAIAPRPGHEIMAAPGQPACWCLGLARHRKDRPRPSGGGTMADSFGLMRGEDAGAA